MEEKLMRRKPKPPVARTARARRIANFVALALVAAVALLLATRAHAACDAGDDACRGIAFTATYTGEPRENVSGGLRRGGAYLDNLDLQLELDGERLFGARGLTAFAYVLYNNAATFSDRFSGDAQVASNIDTGEAWRLYEFWADWRFGDPATHGAHSLRFGLYDLNSEFDAIDTAGLFLNSSHGIGPDYSQSGLNGPSIFPVTSLAVRWRAERDSGVYWQLAVLDAVPGDPASPSSTSVKLGSGEGALLAAEMGRTGERLTKLALGAWQYTAKFDDLLETDVNGDPVRASGNRGFYAIIDGVVAKGEGGTLNAFARVGTAASRFNPYSSCFGVGAVASGFLESRPDDQLGFALALVRNGGSVREAARLAGAPLDDAETVLELTYRAPINGWLVLQPDVQYVLDPGTDPSLDDALVLGLRFEMTYQYER